IVSATVRARGRFDFATHRLHFFGARFPHHARAFTRIAERIDQGLDDFGAVAVRGTLRQERVFDRAAERKTTDALRGPVSRDFFAAHPPNFFGVALEENVEETLAELIADPLLEVSRMPHWKNSRLKPGQNADCRSYDAEFDQRFERFERVGKKFAVVVDLGRARPLKHVVRQNLRPEIFDRFRFREKTMASDIETKTFVGAGARNSANVNRIRFEHGYVDFVFRKQIRGRQSRRSGSYNCDS